MKIYGAGVGRASGDGGRRPEEDVDRARWLAVARMGGGAAASEGSDSGVHGRRRWSSRQRRATSSMVRFEKGGGRGRGQLGER
jgi:hypothetical protein